MLVVVVLVVVVASEQRPEEQQPDRFAIRSFQNADIDQQAVSDDS